MQYRCAVLDDYQNVALQFADWSRCEANVDVTVFNRSLGDNEDVAKGLADFQVVCLMRERTPFPREVIETLPNLRLLVTTGRRNATIDMEAAKDKNVLVCGTDSAAHPTAELIFAHMLEFARKVGFESARLKTGETWQSSVGRDLSGKTLGLVGLGRLGTRVASVAKAFGMKVVAWSQNLTAAKCEEVGVTYTSKEQLLEQSDFISIHVVLGKRTRGLIGAGDLARMKGSAFLINTSRGPIVEEAALVDALRENRIAGAGIDVFDQEPLPFDHPFRTLARAQITPHLGYVTEDNYRLNYGQIVENICAFVAGNPIRVIAS
jgi:phosphoglycerate dehydrogenase-like enzyme